MDNPSDPVTIHNESNNQITLEPPQSMENPLVYNDYYSYNQSMPNFQSGYYVTQGIPYGMNSTYNMVPMNPHYNMISMNPQYMFPINPQYNMMSSNPQQNIPSNTSETINRQNTLPVDQDNVVINSQQMGFIDQQYISSVNPEFVNLQEHYEPMSQEISYQSIPETYHQNIPQENYYNNIYSGEKYETQQHLISQNGNYEPMSQEIHQQSIGNTHYNIPQMIKSTRPAADYYVEIKWGNGFEPWKLVRFSTPMDGNCLFHAIANSFFTPYYSEILNGNQIPRIKIITELRRELSEKLANKINDQSDKRHYDILYGGNVPIFSKTVPEFNIEYMQKQLNSNNHIGYGYMEFIGNALNKDIYILEGIREGIYVTDELPFTIKGNRNSIVLYYMNSHYELVGIQNSDGTFDTHFDPKHNFITFLYSIVKQITKK
jgi:hypothetical protein